MEMFTALILCIRSYIINVLLTFIINNYWYNIKSRQCQMRCDYNWFKPHPSLYRFPFQTGYSDVDIFVVILVLWSPAKRLTIYVLFSCCDASGHLLQWLPTLLVVFFLFVLLLCLELHQEIRVKFIVSTTD